MNEFLIKQTDDAKDLPLPAYQTELSAGMDLHANVHEPITINPMQIKLIPCGIKIALPQGYEAQIRPRSGLALRHGIGMPNAPGTVDGDYRGEISVPLINQGGISFIINRGDRIAQMVINRIEQVRFNVVDELPESQRGDCGFGSTGLAAKTTE